MFVGIVVTSSTHQPLTLHGEFQYGHDLTHAGCVLLSVVCWTPLKGERNVEGCELSWDAENQTVMTCVDIRPSHRTYQFFEFKRPNGLGGKRLLRFARIAVANKSGNRRACSEWVLFRPLTEAYDSSCISKV